LEEDRLLDRKRQEVDVALDRVRQVDNERVREVEGDPTNRVGREVPYLKRKGGCPDPPSIRRDSLISSEGQTRRQVDK
jgi:hypothetical protein